MTLKDALRNDIKAFINPDEFADYHVIDGKSVLCVVDSQKLEEISESSTESLFMSVKTIFASTGDMESLPGGRPKVNHTLVVDGEKYLVVNASEEAGFMEVVLNMVES